MLYGTLAIRVKFSSIHCEKNYIHINNLNLFKEAACEKTLEVLDLDLVQIYALFLIRDVALIAMHFKLCCYKIVIKLCLTKYS